MEIQEIQCRLLEWYRRGCPTDGDYTKFRFQLYLLKHPNPTPEEAFIKGFQIGVRDGFDSGYNTALKDIKSEVDV